MTGQNVPDSQRVPRHVAIIMDGNGRWAAQRQLPRIEGHRRGTQAVEKTLEAAVEAGVEYLTLYAFSVENWSRPGMEVQALMMLLIETLKHYEKKLMEQQIRLRAIGRLQDLPEDVLRQLKKTEEATAGNTRMTLLLALSYGSRVELTEAIRDLAERARAGELDPASIDEKMISGHLYTAGIPDPDLLIRTSGEMRLSNFLLWQLSYTEIYVTPVFWPDFGREDFFKAVAEYSNRHRRFGGV